MNQINDPFMAFVDKCGLTEGDLEQIQDEFNDRIMAADIGIKEDRIALSTVPTIGAPPRLVA